MSPLGPATWLLCALLFAGILLQAAAAAAPGTADPPWWTVDPHDPGESLPPTGRSLFDFLVIRQGAGGMDYAVPFPYTSLVRHIEARLKPDRSATLPGLKQVLIPLGRSLQRRVAEGEFFQYPRVVLAVDEEPAAGPAAMLLPGAPPGAMLLKDRLFLGYHEKAGVIEAISYNESAGRFEFQLVKDYRPGGTPRVFYANRALCMSCHQNGGPIFPRPAWDETNANPRIRALLRREQRDFYGIDFGRGVDLPNAIDNATDRANRFAALQLLWREGCGAEDALALRCRAALFTALLQYRLSGSRQFTRGETWQADVALPMAAHGKTRWPHGLALPDPDIANRNLFPAEGQDTLPTPAPLTPPFDPLAARPPLEVWPMGRAGDAERAVSGLAEFLAAADITRLDGHLRRLAVGRPRLSLRTACQFVARTRSRGDGELVFQCGSAGAVPAMAGRIETLGGRVLGGSLHRLSLDVGSVLQDIRLTGGALASQREERRALLRLHREDGPVRGADGNAVEAIELIWPVSADAVVQGHAGIVVAQDFDAVGRAVAAMLADALAGRLDGFSSQPFRRARLMPALFERLGAKPGAWCCLDAAGMPPPQLEAEPARTVQKLPAAATEWAAREGARAGLHVYCAACHRSPARFPPNFLSGDGQRIAARLAQCAPRLYVRLAMWGLKPAARLKTPMPPETALPSLHGAVEQTRAEQWRASPELQRLTAYAGDLLRAETGKPPDLAALAADYDRLPPCLPPGFGDGTPPPGEGNHD